MLKLKYSMEDKHRECSLVSDKIRHCKTERELEEVGFYIDECLVVGRLFKKDYKYLVEELDDRLMTLVEEGLV